MIEIWEQLKLLSKCPTYVTEKLLRAEKERLYFVEKAHNNPVHRQILRRGDALRYDKVLKTMRFIIFTKIAKRTD